MTTDELIQVFPECDKIKREDIAECITKAMTEERFYKEASDKVYRKAQELWPYQRGLKDDDPERVAYKAYFWGNILKDVEAPFKKWQETFETEFIAQHGQVRTFDEACQVAADEWARMIFGRHIQDNGDKSSDGVFGNMLATIVKDRCCSGYGQDVIDRFREAIKQHYLGHCIYESKEHGSYRDIPDCDYHPSPSLRKALSDAGCKDDDISYMCPCKTCIIIDEVDNSVCIRGYQTARYM